MNGWALENGVQVEFHDFFSVTSWSDDIYGTLRTILIVVCFIVIFIVTFGIMNVVSVNLFDRKKEIGTYYCLGAERRFLICMYSIEILVVNIAAGFAGILFGLFVRFIINVLNITTNDTGLKLVFGSDSFHLGFSASTVTWLLAGIILVTFLTSVTSLGSSLKVSPSVAVREVEE